MALPKDVKFVTSDCYGTLIDWEGGAAAFLYDPAGRRERDQPPARELNCDRAIMAHTLRHSQRAAAAVTPGPSAM